MISEYKEQLEQERLDSAMNSFLTTFDKYSFKTTKEKEFLQHLTNITSQDVTDDQMVEFYTFAQRNSFDDLISKLDKLTKSNSDVDKWMLNFKLDDIKFRENHLMEDGVYGEHIRKDGTWVNSKFRHDPKVHILNGGCWDLEIDEKTAFSMSEKQIDELLNELYEVA